MTRTQLSVCGLVVALVLGCERDDCDAPAVPLSGHYVLEGPNSALAIDDAVMDIGKDEVSVSYTDTDGSHWRATYRIRARGATSSSR